MSKRKILLVFALLLLLVTPFTLAAQENTPQPTVGQWQVPFTALGLSDSLRVSGQVAQRDLFIPVPVGVTAVALRADVQLSADVESGYLEVRSGNTVLTTTTLPLTDNVLNVPLAGAVVRDNVLPLTIAARLRSQDDVCSTALIGAWMDLHNGQIDFDGAAVPVNVSDFLPRCSRI